MSPYRTNIMNTEEEVGYLRRLLVSNKEETEQLNRLLASAEARLQAARGEQAPASVAVPVDLASAISDLSAAAQADWQSFYRQYFGLELNFSSLRIPERKEGFDRLLIMAASPRVARLRATRGQAHRPGMTADRLFARCKELFPCWKYENNLDSITSVREPTTDYAVWVRDRVEADEELKNKSANDLKDEGIFCITLAERLLYELKYFQESGKHLDLKNITLCAGSRYGGGSVPGVCWDSGGLKVGYFYPGNSNDGLRARAAVYA